MTIADKLKYHGPPDEAYGIVSIHADGLSANRVLVFRQKDNNLPHHSYEWMFEVQPGPQPALMLVRVERDAAGHDVPGSWLGVCRFNWSGHVDMGPFNPNAPPS